MDNKVPKDTNPPQDDGIKGHEKQKTEENTEKFKREAEEYKNRFLRALADYQNLEKRITEEKHQIEKRAQVHMAMKLVPILDNLEKAEVFIKDPGLNLVHEGFKKILNELEIQEIDVLHKPFDPHLAEAVELVSGEKNDNVVEVVRKGYRIKDRILRPAQVKVSKTGEK